MTVKKKVEEEKFEPLISDIMSKHIFGTYKNLKFSEMLINDYGVGSKIIHISHGRELDKTLYDEKKYITDIILELSKMENTMINIEAYTNFNRKSLNKSIQYLCSLVASNKKRGKGYDDITKVIQVNIVKNNTVMKNKGFYEYEMINRKTGEAIEPFAKMYIITVDQKGWERYNVNRKQLGWIMLFRARTKEEALKAVEIYPELGEVLEEMISFANGTLKKAGWFDAIELRDRKIRRQERQLDKKEKQLEEQYQQLYLKDHQLDEKDQQIETAVKYMSRNNTPIEDICKIFNLNYKLIQKIINKK